MSLDAQVKACRKKLAHCRSADLVKAFGEVSVVRDAIGGLLAEASPRYNAALLEMNPRKAPKKAKRKKAPARPKARKKKTR